MLGGSIPIERVRELAGDANFIAAMRDLYRSLDERVAARKPTCLNRGDCCKFDSYGHALYVTSAEVAFFLGMTEGPLLPVGSSKSCPYQQSGRCTVRSARPMGCRVFFCEITSRDWQPDETEHTLREIKALHRRFDLPYAYVEWLDALRQLDTHPSGHSERSREI